jgi:hypothetical protein
MDSGSPGSSTVTNTNIPENLNPSMEALVGRVEALVGKDQQLYGGERFAYATPDQISARYGASKLGKPGGFAVGTGMVGAGGMEALKTAHYSPREFTPEKVGIERVGFQPFSAARSEFQPILERFQMESPEMFSREQAQQYMSPYMQEVVDIEKRKAMEDAQRVSTQAGLAAARQGTYGGARQSLESSQRERALLQNLGDIQSRGSQLAFEQAQNMFEKDRAARMAAGRENLAAALDVQKLGVSTNVQIALANLTNEQQTRVINQAKQLEAGGMNQDQALRAALANAGIDLDAQKLSEQSEQFGAELGLRGAGTAIEAGRALASIGSEELKSDIERLKTKEMFGKLTQDEEQRLYDLSYEDFLRQQEYPFKTEAFLADIIRGIPGRSVYERPAGSNMANIVGTGLTALGASREFSRI